MPKVSPQLKWARKQKKRGRCTRCGVPRNRYKQLCDTHQEGFTRYMREWRKSRKEQNANNQRDADQGNQDSPPAL
jgi:hypothetical protein